MLCKQITDKSTDSHLSPSHSHNFHKIHFKQWIFHVISIMCFRILIEALNLLWFRSRKNNCNYLLCAIFIFHEFIATLFSSSIFATTILVVVVVTAATKLVLRSFAVHFNSSLKMVLFHFSCSINFSVHNFAEKTLELCLHKNRIECMHNMRVSVCVCVCNENELSWKLYRREETMIKCLYNWLQ